MWRAAFKQEPRPGARATAWPCLASLDLPTTLEPSSLTVGEAGDFKCLRDPPQAPCLRRPGLFPLASTSPAITQSNCNPTPPPWEPTTEDFGGEVFISNPPS